MSDVASKLTDRRNKVWHEAKELADSVADENRNFSAEEDSKWSSLNSEMDALDRRIKAVIEGEQRAKDAENAMVKLRGEPQHQGPGQGRNDELRTWMRGEGGRTFEVRPQNGQATDFRTLSKLTAGAGANTVPTSFHDRLVAHMIESSAILQSGATILQTASGEEIQVPKTTAHSTGARVAEAGTIGASDPVFGQVPLRAYKYARLIQVSRELLADSGVDLEGYLAMQVGRALGNTFGADAIAGDGDGKPTGVLDDISTGEFGVAADGGFGSQGTAGQGADHLISLFYSVISPYRNSQACHWLMNDSTAGVVRRLKTADGAYVWMPALVAGTPDQLLGKPVLTDPNVPEIGELADSVIFGDFSGYFVRLAGALRFERSEDFAFDEDLVTFRAVMRADGATVDTSGALKCFTGGAEGS